MNPNSWLRATVLEECEVEFSDTRPLYGYRCRTPLFDRMAESLRPAYTVVSGRHHLDNAWAGMYCLYAAEWWRRNHEGGSWSWSGIDESLGWSSFPATERYSMIRLGMTWWKREVMKRHDGENLYLVTIACEGGLPLKLLHNENSNLGKYFKALLVERQLVRESLVTTSDLAERLCDHLPRTLHNDVVYELSGQLIDAVISCRQLLGEVSKYPLDQLDNIKPEWRDDLPLRLEDSVAQSLIADLLAERSTPKIKHQRQLCTVTRRLTKKTGVNGWLSELIINVPSKINDDSLRLQLQVDKQNKLPSHLELRAQVGDSEHSIALMNQLASGSQDWRIRTASGASEYVITGADAIDDISLRVMSGSEEHVSWEPNLSTALADDLPWVFLSPVGATLENVRQLEFIGSGSLVSRESCLFVALPKGWEILGDVNEISSDVGVTQIEQRRLIQLNESVVLVSADSERCSLELGAAEDDLPEYRVIGNRVFWRYHKRPVYSGLPRLSRQLGESAVSVPVVQLFWRPVGVYNAEWVSCSERSPLGDVRIRHITGSDVQFDYRSVVLPSEATIKVKTGRSKEGTISLNHFNLTDCAVEEIDSAEVNVDMDSSAARIHVKGDVQQSTELNVKLSWNKNESATLRLPLPLENAAFIRADGSSVAFHSTISIDELMGMTARVVSPSRSGFNMEVELHDPTMSRNISNACNYRLVLEQSNGVNSVALGPMSHKLRRLLAMRSSLDSAINLELSNSSKSRIRVKRFQTHLIADWETGDVRLADEVYMGLDQLALEAISLVEPGVKSAIPYQEDTANWSASGLSAQLAPWLIVARYQGMLVGRPTVAPVRVDSSVELEAEGSTPAAMRAVLQEPEFKTRNKMMSRCAQEMATDTSHVGWAYMKRSMAEFSDYPPSSFDFVMRLAENPDALAMGLFVLRGAEAEQYWQLAETMGFDWRLLSLRSWVNAAKFSCLSLKETLPEEMQNIAVEETNKKLDQIVERIPEFDMLMHCIRDHVAGVENRQIMVHAFDAQCAHLLTAQFDVLLRSHVEGEVWPDESQLPEWIEHDFSIELPEFKTLQQLQTLRDYRQAVVDAPVMAALQLAKDQFPGRDQLSYFIAFRDFDSEWFDTALGLVMAWGFLNRDWSSDTHV